MEGDSIALLVNTAAAIHGRLAAAMPGQMDCWEVSFFTAITMFNGKNRSGNRIGQRIWKYRRVTMLIGILIRQNKIIKESEKEQ